VGHRGVSAGRVATAALAVGLLSVGAALSGTAAPAPSAVHALDVPDPFPLGTCVHLGPVARRPVCVLVNP
jgi:hypothetical protein